jgi:hypothetical protein
MENIRLVVRITWWLMLAAAPLIFWNFIDNVFVEIGCPPRGDCYRPGSTAAFELDVLVSALAIFIWPACIWFLGGRWMVYRLLGLEPPNNSFKPRPLRGSA